MSPGITAQWLGKPDEMLGLGGLSTWELDDDTDVWLSRHTLSQRDGAVSLCSSSVL